MATDAVNPDTGNPGFFIAKVGGPDVETFCQRITGHSCHGLVQGWTSIPFGGSTIVIYALSERPEVLIHEFMHILYFLWKPTEECPQILDTEGDSAFWKPMIGFRWNYIEHGGPCDPFAK